MQTLFVSSIADLLFKRLSSPQNREVRGPSCKGCIQARARKDVMSPVHIPAVLTKEEGLKTLIADMLKEMGGDARRERSSWVPP